MLVTPPIPVPGLPAQVVATDGATGPDAIIGAGAACYKSPAPMAAPATIQIKATKGGGTAAVQILVK
ncbi:MAG: hypothetical protein IPM79_38220 [Polyangiaceae bacterium]|nr:hypothetical protein [Polyangiaceae bacterium]